MKVITNLTRGFKATGRSQKMILLLFIINLLFSLLLAIPMYNSLKDSFGYSEAGDRMAEGFDYLWWEEFRDQSRGLETTFTPSIIGKGAILNNLEGLARMRFLSLPPIILIAGVLYIILHTFLAGGILSIFKEKTLKFTMEKFFRGAGKYFFPFILLTLSSWIFFYAVVTIFGSGFNFIVRDVSRNSLSEIPPFYLGLLFNVILLFLFFFIQMVFDYARIKIVLEDHSNIFKTALNALSFVLKHPLSTLGLYYLIFFISFVVSVLYILFKEIIPQSTWPGVLIAFFLQQLFIFAIIWLRCCLYSSQMELYRYSK